jgi:hypothetical protein
MTIEVTPSYIRYYLFYGWDGWGTWLASFHKSKGNKYKLSFEVHIHFPWVFIEQTLIRSSYQPWEKRVPWASISRGWSLRWIFRWFSSACPRWTTYQNGSNLELACDRKCCFVLWCRSVLCYSVHLVELRGTGELYAMKAMEKSVMLNRNKVWVFLRKLLVFIFACWKSAN